jgi:SAM-dependent methyltransferase
MSFTPLPKIFTDICLALDSSKPRILELGCGDGRFRTVLADHDIFSWGLDRLGPAGGTVAHLVGDALALPVAVGSLDLLLVPNLLRHLVPKDPGLGFLARWLDFLKPGGSLFIFEDEPATEPAGAAHYRDLQEFLSRLMPESRGPLLPLADFMARIAAPRFSCNWEFGMIRNTQNLDADVVQAFLDPGTGHRGESGRLRIGIDRDGLDPGDYWWARASSGMERTGS